MADPAVSVILPTHNSAPFVSRAIDSVLSQEGNYPLELIIVDDCSSDETVQFIDQRYGLEARIDVIAVGQNAGPGAARNQALARAKAPWIALIDADDAWAPDRLSALLPLCTKDIDILFDNIIGFDQAAGMETGLLFPFLPPRMTVPAMAAGQAPGSTFDYGYLKPLIRRDFLRETKVEYPEVRISEDLHFYLEILINGARTKTLDQGFYIYTTSLGQMSGRLSTLSATAPDDELVASRLDALATKYKDQLGADERESISSRADRLRRLAPVSRLHHSWTKGDYLGAVRQCLVDRTARRHLVRAIFKRLFRSR